MAAKKQQPEATEARGKLRVRFWDVEIEGSNETLLESIRQITAATTPRAPAVRQVTAATVARTFGPATNEADVDEEDKQPEAEVEEIEEESQPLARPTPPRKPRAPKPPPLSTNLKVDEDPMPLQAFLDGTTVTDASSDQDKVIAVATWMKEFRQLDEISGSDFFTICQLRGWTAPVDPTSPMRNLKRDSKMGSGSKPGKFVLTVLGVNDFKRLKKS